jgi:hypothetical protein
MYDADDKDNTMQTGNGVMKVPQKNFGCVKLGVGSADPGSSDYHELCLPVQYKAPFCLIKISFS